MKLNTNNKGAKYEKQGAKYLKQKGYKILATNFHAKFGELDIIAQKDNFMVFVEIKGRTSTETNTKLNSMQTQMKSQMKTVKGFEHVNQNKINRLIKTAQIYMMENNYCGLARFDIISIDNGNITHIENAFGL